MLIVAVSLVVLTGVYVFMVTRPSATPDTYAKAKTTQASAKCLVEDTTLAIPHDQRDAIELAAVSYLVDVPAGTNVDVKIAKYAKDEVTGADYYPSKYGTYNFAMAKQSDNWIITDFKRCSQ